MEQRECSEENLPCGLSKSTVATWTVFSGLEPCLEQKVSGQVGRVKERALLMNRVSSLSLFLSLVFWTGMDFSESGKDQQRTALQAEPRLHEMRARIRAMGILTSPLQPLWCALRPGSCMGGDGLA